MSEDFDIDYEAGDFDEDIEEEDTTCCEGFTAEEDCDAPVRIGIEHCEFMCPFHRLDGLYELTECYYCGKPIKKGEIYCKKCDPFKLFEEKEAKP